MDKQFTWIPFYMELADKLRGFEEDRTELLNVITQIYEKLGIPLPTLEKDGMLPVDIDPFTFIGFFNKGIKDSTRMEIIKIIAELFCIKADIPTDFNGIPVLSNMNAVFYHFIGERGEHDIDNLWKVFSAAIDYSDNPSDENRAEFCNYYDLVLKQKGIKRNLSIGLFWIRPHDYLSLDSRNLEFMGNSDNLSDEFSGSIAALKGSAPSAEDYLQLCENCRNELASGQQEYKDFPALSYYVWINGKNEEQEWWPSLDEYDPGFTVEDWIKLLGDKKVFDENSLIVIKAFYDAGGESTCKELANNSDQTMDFYRNVSVSLAKRIHKETGCPLEINKDGSNSWWSVLFIGKNAGKKQTGIWVWRLRDELKEAYEVFIQKPDEWFPSPEEYTPGFTKEKWLELLNNKNIIGPVWGGVLAAFYEAGGAATCTQIAKTYNTTAPSISGMCTALWEDEHKCPCCGANLKKQADYNEYDNDYTCDECDSVLHRDYSGEEFSVVDDRDLCPNCNAYLKNQCGYSDSDYDWTCSECDAELHREYTSNQYSVVEDKNLCPNCGTSLLKQSEYSEDLIDHTCSECDAVLHREYNWIEFSVVDKKDICPNCGANLKNQEEYDEEDTDYTCDECKTVLHRDYSSDEFSVDDETAQGICPNCKADLNEQYDYDEYDDDDWTCTACGAELHRDKRSLVS